MTTITKYSQFSFSATSTTVSITAPATDGAILISFQLPTGTTVSSVTDSAGGTYTLDHTRAKYNADGDLFVYRRHNIDNAPTSVTVNYSAAVTTTVGVLVVDGMSAGSITPTVTSQADTSYGTTHTASFTTSSANEIGFIIWSQSAGEASTATTSGWSVIDGTDRSQDAGYNVDLGAAGAKTAEFTSAAGVFRRYSILTYPPAGGGGAATSFPPIKSSGMSFAPYLSF